MKKSCTFFCLFATLCFCISNHDNNGRRKAEVLRHCGCSFSVRVITAKIYDCQLFDEENSFQVAVKNGRRVTWNTCENTCMIVGTKGRPLFFSWPLWPPNLLSFFLRYDQRLGGSIVVFSSKETLDGIRVLTKSFLLNKQVALKGRPKPRNVSGNAECAKPLKKKKTESQLCKTKSWGFSNFRKNLPLSASIKGDAKVAGLTCNFASMKPNSSWHVPFFSWAF